MKIFERIKIILKGVITKIRHLRAKFEPGKSNFDATHYRFGSDKVARMRARKKKPIQINM
jgi:hypothetical protein